MNGPKFRRLYLLVMLLLLVSLISIYITGYADSTSEQKIDAVLTVDVSTSMNSSDKNRVANEAMKMFIDMLSVQGNKVGIVAYTDTIIRARALLAIQAAEDKEELKSYINTLSREPYTDIAVGVGEAVNVMIANHDPDHAPIIILLADGNNSLNSNSSQADSDKNLAVSVAEAKKNGIPIYTIGLNADGKLNKAVLEGISNETGGKFFETGTAADLPRILSEIFASHLKVKVIPVADLVANGEYQDVTLTIPSGNVMEANITMIANKPVDALLYEPSGQEVNLQSDRVVYSRSTSYSLIKLANPPQGDWKLRVKGVDKDQIDINLVFNYDLTLQLDPLAQDSYEVGDQIEVRAWLESNGQGIAASSGMKATLQISNMGTQQMEEILINHIGQDFKSSFEAGVEGEYEVKVRLDDANFYRETAPVAFTITPATTQAVTPSVPPIPKPVVLNNEPDKPFPWLTVALIALGILMLLGLILYVLSQVKKANKGFYGQMIIEIRDDNTGESMSPQYRKLNAFKGKLRLHHLMQLAPEYIETEHVIFKPGSNDTLMLFNQSTCVIEKSGRAFDATKGVTIQKNDRLKVILPSAGKTIQLEYIN